MSIFCKRHYEAVASAIQEARRRAPMQSTEVAGIDTVMLELADTFARDNGMFKRDRFIRACEPGANVRART